ncbi:MAG TPA: 6-phosphofructokinase [Acidimicrobiia bacterium]|nr:6-phosphofructokinase [Acidimicrobiia bacterium]
MRIAVLTSGGDAPGMNAAIRAVTKVGAGQGVDVHGIQGGYEGLLAGRFIRLTHEVGGSLHPERAIDLALGQGGTILGSSRSEAFRTKEGRAEAAERLAGFDGLVAIGGDGTLSGAHALASEQGTRVIGVPASIDNDVGCTSLAIGVDTALNTIVEACSRVADTARSHRRAFVVEVMGRRSGYLAMSSAVTVGADAAVIPEQARSVEEIAASVERVIRQSFELDDGKRQSLIMLAEGAGVPATELVRLLNDRLEDLPGVEARAIVLGHLQRGGSPSYLDRMIGGRLGLMALAALSQGRSDEMVAWRPSLDGGIPTEDSRVMRYPLERVMEESAALVDGSSEVVQRRLKMMEAVEGVLAL